MSQQQKLFISYTELYNAIVEIVDCNVPYVVAIIALGVSFIITSESLQTYQIRGNLYFSTYHIPYNFSNYHWVKCHTYNNFYNYS